MRSKLTQIAKICAIVAAGSTLGMVDAAYAGPNDMDVRAQVDALQAQINALKSRLEAVQVQQAQQAATPAPAPAATAAPSNDQRVYLERKKDDDGVTFLTRGGEVTFYGNLDVSFDSTTKGIGNMTAGPNTQNPGAQPVGNNGWMPAISTNLSSVGLRGHQDLGDYPATFVWQLETQVDISATSGTTNTNSNTSDAVKGGLTSRNSFIGLSSPTWGAIKIGKTDAPYKTSTAMMNAFSGMLGDYSVIMGNTGGDNRVEFGTRLDHSIWWESPNWGGWAMAVLASPGQNRATDNSNLASGESDCTGGNIATSGGGTACQDGSYGNAYSVSLARRSGNLYLTAAWELHQNVNRVSDNSDANDIGDETAAKVGAQYPISGIYEVMNRKLPDSLVYYNERSRTGTWFAVSQDLSARDSLHFGWAHANATPGDPGVHNTVGPTANQDNAADMFTLAWKHKVDRNFSYYTNYATTMNHSAAHYDLGAGGRSVTTDCHDAAGATDGTGNCYAGGRLEGVSVGMKYQF